MRALVFAFIFWGSWAFAVEPLDASARYQEVIGKKTQSVALGEMDLFFSRQVFKTLRGRGLATTNSLAWLDRIYAYGKKNQLVLVKSGIQLSGKISADRIYKQGKGFLIHLPLADKKENVALFFIGFNKELVRSMADQLKVKLAKSKTVAKDNGEFSWPSFLPVAHAELADDHTYCTQNGQAPPPPSQDTIDVMQAGWGCLQGVGAGLWDATVGTLQMTWNGVSYLFTHWPTETWDTMSAQAAEIGNLVQNFPQLMGGFQEQFNALPADIRAKVICEVATAIGAPTLFAILTGGASTPALALKIAEAFKKVAAMAGNPRAIKIAEDFSVYIARHPPGVFGIKRYQTYKNFDVLEGALKHREEMLQLKTLATQKLAEHLISTPPRGSSGLNNWNGKVKELELQLRNAEAKYAASVARVQAAQATVIVENHVEQPEANRLAEEISKYVAPLTSNASAACLVTQRLTEHLPGAESEEVSQ